MHAVQARDVYRDELDGPYGPGLSGGPELLDPHPDAAPGYCKA